MRYVVFTTKHRDGRCMLDSKLRDDKVTDPKCPFHDDPRADVTRMIFDAFRTEGMWTGAHFSNSPILEKTWRRITARGRAEV